MRNGKNTNEYNINRNNRQSEYLSDDNTENSIGGINVYVHHGGDSVTRSENFLKWKKMIQSRSNGQKGSWAVSVVLTTYDLAIRDLGLLRKLSVGPNRCVDGRIEERRGE